VPKTCKFIQKLIYNCFWYKELQNKEKQEEQHSKVIETVESLDENIIMKIENKIDFQVIPKFNYLTKVEDNDDKKITTQIGCNCENGCFPASSCCAQLLDIKPAFNRFGELSATEHQLIVECGEFCGCDKTKCVNHVKKSKLNLCVFKTQTRGWALKTLQSIQAGSFVIEYTGELVDAENAKLRTRSYKKKGIVDQYLFDLDYNDMNEAIYSIDATQKGNLSRFINHSCSANLQTWPAIYPSEDKNKHRLYYFALRFIRAGEELTVDYSGGIIGGSPKKIPTNAKVCRCQSENCRGFIF
jgi:SET domain-containing protein